MKKDISSDAVASFTDMARMMGEAGEDEEYDPQEHPGDDGDVRLNAVMWMLANEQERG